MTIVFMGTPDYATTILKELLTCSDMQVPLLVTQPDKPVGRKQVLTPPDVKAFVMDENIDIEVYQPKNLRSEETCALINSFNPDFIVVAAYGQILPKAILDIAPCINLHASLLPKYRGASPIQSSLLHNDQFTGVTSMLMEAGLDTGDILGLSYIELDKSIKVDKLFDELATMAAKLTVNTLRNFSKIMPIKQKSLDASYAKKIRKSDGLVSFEENTADEIYTKFRAYDPWPGLFLDSGLKLRDINVVKKEKNCEVGKIISIENDIVVACKDGAIAVKLVQPASKKEMSAVDYARGRRISVGNKVV
jgi:methionyl-tRNA formyltransferase